jgi:sigma-70-like protein
MLAPLGDRERAAVVLRGLGWSYSDAAERLGVTVRRLGQILARARRSASGSSKDVRTCSSCPRACGCLKGCDGIRRRSLPTSPSGAKAAARAALDRIKQLRAENWTRNAASTASTRCTIFATAAPQTSRAGSTRARTSTNPPTAISGPSAPCSTPNAASSSASATTARQPTCHAHAHARARPRRPAAGDLTRHGHVTTATTCS